MTNKEQYFLVLLKDPETHQIHMGVDPYEPNTLDRFKQWSMRELKSVYVNGSKRGPYTHLAERGKQLESKGLEFDVIKWPLPGEYSSHKEARMMTKPFRKAIGKQFKNMGIKRIA